MLFSGGVVCIGVAGDRIAHDHGGCTALRSDESGELAVQRLAQTYLMDRGDGTRCCDRIQRESTTDSL